MKITSRRSINMKNFYILGVSAIAFISIAGNLFQNHFYNKAIEVQKETIFELSNTNHVTQDVMANQ